MTKDTNTEQKIIEAARRIFMVKGMSGARMQEIADEAGINKALLHYYFRSKEKLFERIFDEVIKRISGGLKIIFSEEASVLERLYKIVDVYIDALNENRYIPLFVINEINSNPERLSALFQEHVLEHMGKLIEQVQEEGDAGIINPIHPAHLMLNVLGMVIFPFVAYPVIHRVSEAAFEPLVENFFQERKEVIRDFIQNALTPKKQ